MRRLRTDRPGTPTPRPDACAHRSRSHARETAGRPRWRGGRGFLEAWYATLTDPATGTGVWLHHELVAPPRGEPRTLGWAAVFPAPGQDEPALVRRIGPHPAPATPRSAGPDWFSDPSSRVAPGLLAGRTDADPAAEPVAWDLVYEDTGGPLFTFGRGAWGRLPSAQAVPSPTARFSGLVDAPGHRLRLEEAPGAVAHLYGHANAQQWGWLHADLGDGDVLEVVTAAARVPGLRHLPPVAAVRLRRGGTDRPATPMLAAPLSRTRLGLPDWNVLARQGRRRLRIEVHQPPERCVTMDYADPDGAPAQCTNTETGDAEVVLERWRRGWTTETRWSLRGTAHAEVGTRPSSPPS